MELNAYLREFGSLAKLLSPEKYQNFRRINLEYLLLLNRRKPQAMQSIIWDGIRSNYYRQQLIEVAGEKRQKWANNQTSKIDVAEQIPKIDAASPDDMIMASQIIQEGITVAFKDYKQASINKSTISTELMRQAMNDVKDAMLSDAMDGKWLLVAAFKQLNKAIKTHRVNYLAQFNFAYLSSFFFRNLERADKHFNLAVQYAFEQDTNFTVFALRHLAEVRRERGDFDGAINAANEAFMLDRDKTSMIKFDLSRYLILSKQDEKAVHYLESLLKEHPEYFWQILAEPDFAGNEAVNIILSVLSPVFLDNEIPTDEDSEPFLNDEELASVLDENARENESKDQDISNIINVANEPLEDMVVIRPQNGRADDEVDENTLQPLPEDISNLAEKLVSVNENPSDENVDLEEGASNDVIIVRQEKEATEENIILPDELNELAAEIDAYLNDEIELVVDETDSVEESDLELHENVDETEVASETLKTDENVSDEVESTSIVKEEIESKNEKLDNAVENTISENTAVTTFLKVEEDEREILKIDALSKSAQFSEDEILDEIIEDDDEIVEEIELAAEEIDTVDNEAETINDVEKETEVSIEEELALEEVKFVEEEVEELKTTDEPELNAIEEENETSKPITVQDLLRTISAKHNLKNPVVGEDITQSTTDDESDSDANIVVEEATEIKDSVVENTKDGVEPETVVENAEPEQPVTVKEVADKNSFSENELIETVITNTESGEDDVIFIEAPKTNALLENVLSKNVDKEVEEFEKLTSETNDNIQQKSDLLELVDSKATDVEDETFTTNETVDSSSENTFMDTLEKQTENVEIEDTQSVTEKSNLLKMIDEKSDDEPQTLPTEVFEEKQPEVESKANEVKPIETKTFETESAEVKPIETDDIFSKLKKGKEDLPKLPKKSKLEKIITHIQWAEEDTIERCEAHSNIFNRKNLDETISNIRKLSANGIRQLQENPNLLETDFSQNLIEKIYTKADEFSSAKMWSKLFGK